VANQEHPTCLPGAWLVANETARNEVADQAWVGIPQGFTAQGSPGLMLTFAV